MRSTVKSVLTSIGLALALVGCGGGVNIMTINAKTHTTDLVINNGNLQSNAEIVSGKGLYNEQLMQVVVQIQSHSNDSQKLYWKCAWYDGDGFPLPDEGWHFLPLLGNEQKPVAATASAPKAERCDFMLRRRSTDDRENQ